MSECVFGFMIGNEVCLLDYIIVYGESVNTSFYSELLNS